MFRSKERICFEGEDWRLLGSGSAWPGRILPTFWRRIRPPYFRPKTEAICFDEITKLRYVSARPQDIV